VGIFRRKSRPVEEFWLGNGELRNQQNPRTFFIPTRAERESVEPGDLVKLLFEVVNATDDMPSAERMWVKVTVADGGRYVGELDNEPAALQSIGPGSRIEFGPEHIISLMDNWPLGGLKAVVSKRSHVQDLRPHYACRYEPLKPQDSGWQVLVGDETDEELSDASNVLVQPLGFVADRWPELRPMFDAGEVGSEWVWDDAANAYVRLAYEG
jgi:hypothetical protein